MACRAEISEDPVVVENTIFVAVGKRVKKCRPVLLWALQKYSGKGICILHVHRPAQRIPILGAKAPISSAQGKIVRDYQETEKQHAYEIVDKYILICREMGIQAHGLVGEADCIKEKIVELICLHGIRNLVMGAVARNYCTGTYVRSEKARYVRDRAPVSCHIQFVCKGYVIITREASEEAETRNSNDGRSWSGSSRHSGNEFDHAEEPSCPNSIMEIEGYSDEPHLSRNPLELGGSTCPPGRGVRLIMTPVAEDENGRHSSAVRSSFIDGSLEVTTLRGKFQEVEGEMEVLYGAHKELTRKITGAALAKERELERIIKIQRNQLRDNLRSSNEQVTLFESQITELQDRVNELEVKHDNLLMEAQDLRRKQEGSTENMPEFFVFSLSDIKEATQNFSRTLKIGHGGFGEIYRGKLNQVEVAIKMPHPPGTHSHDAQAPKQFQMEVVVLSRLRHPNLVKLIGCCPEVLALVYEYLPNGSLEDRLNCRGNSPPLSWEARIRIATELCSVLMYLHSIKPHSIVHGDLKPSNILLDANFVCKLGDFGICRMLVPETGSSDGRTLFRITDPKGTIPYADPEFQETGVLTLESDVYAFGIILLQLLTRIEPRLVANEVNCSIKAGNLESLLDASAGDWPIDHARELAQLGLRCCNRNRKGRPKLESDIWKVLELITASYAASSSSRARP